jgi:hypothetical protein
MVYEQIQRTATRRWARWLTALTLAAGLVSVPAVAADKGRGYVDPNTFIRIAGDDAIQIQVSVSKAMLNLVTRNPELKAIAGGLESIEAVVLDLSRRGVAESARKAMLDTESRLRGKGWERIVLVRDGEGEVRILVLPDDDSIQGLVVMIMDSDDGTMVFANIAGEIDLAAIEDLGEAFEIPGLEDLELDEGE